MEMWMEVKLRRKTQRNEKRGDEGSVASVCIASSYLTKCTVPMSQEYQCGLSLEGMENLLM